MALHVSSSSNGKMDASAANEETLDERSLYAMMEHDRIEADSRPNSIAECYDQNGDLDPNLHAQFLDKEVELDDAERNHFQALLDRLEWEEEGRWNVGRAAKKARSRRRFKNLRPYFFDQNGNLKHLKPMETVWCIVHCMNDREQPQQSKLFAKFRKRFRMPHEQFLELLERVKVHGLFARWTRRDASGSPPSPIGLLLLGSLRCLGRGLTFDDLEEFTATDEETHRQFFHKFIECGETALLPFYVRMPKTADQFQTHRHEFNVGGLWGCGFSADATNVVMWRCQHNLKQAHSGFKSSHPTRSYNVCVNHRGRMLSSTTGHPSRWNDKTLAWFDDFMCGTHKGKLLDDSTFDLLYWAGEPGKSDVLREKCRGAWGLADNGYHRWSCTQAPGKVHSLVIDQRLSEWIESFRKDVECVFGTLKGRFRALKTGIRLEGPVAADRMWLTCCALHNWLLEVDGMDVEWQGDCGKNDTEECRRLAPFAIRRLNNNQLQNFGSREHENEACENVVLARRRDEDMVEADDAIVSNIRRDEAGRIHLNSLSYFDFRHRLVEHFDILHRHNKVKWPRREKQRNPTNNQT